MLVGKMGLQGDLIAPITPSLAYKGSGVECRIRNQVGSLSTGFQTSSKSLHVMLTRCMDTVCFVELMHDASPARCLILYNSAARDATQYAAQGIWARQKALELNSKHAYRQYQDTAHRTAVRRVLCTVLGGAIRSCLPLALLRVARWINDP